MIECGRSPKKLRGLFIGMSFQNMIGGLDVMFTSDERKSDIQFLNHLKLHVDVVPGSVRVWTHLMRFLDQGIGGGGG